MKIKLPPTVKAIIDSLQAAGFEAYAVGGCVRDAVLFRAPDDWDITTSAKPEEIKRIFHRTVDTGVEHGTVTVLTGGAAHEVTTYRIDGVYRDHRHPEQVRYTDLLEEDLARRDFTINAMAYNDEKGLVDPFGGMHDLQRKLVRCVGDADARFAEDALRILRALRFAAQLGFSIEEASCQAIRSHAHELREISAERISVELVKLITSGRPELLLQAASLGITEVILPEFDAMLATPQNTPYHVTDVGHHTVRAIRALPDCADQKTQRILCIALLLHDVGKSEKRTTDAHGIDHFIGHAELGEEMAAGIMRRLKMDNETISCVRRLVRYHDWRIRAEEKHVRRAVAKIGAELFPLLLMLQRADISAQSDRIKAETLIRIDAVEALYHKILEEQQCVQIKDLAVNGRDLIAAGVPEGPEIGEILKEMLELVLDDPARNTREELMAQLGSKYQQPVH